jgi:hypothetical protein
MTDLEKREIQLLTIQNIMQTENGRDFAWRCLQEAGTYGIVFDRDPIQHAYNSAQRELGLWFESELKEAAPDKYLQMIKEHTNV